MKYTHEIKKILFPKGEMNREFIPSGAHNFPIYFIWVFDTEEWRTPECFWNRKKKRIEIAKLQWCKGYLTPFFPGLHVGKY